MEYNPENLSFDKMTRIMNALPVGVLHNIFKSIDITNLNWLVESYYRKLFVKDLAEITDLDEIKKVHLWALTSKINKSYPALKRYTNLKILQYFARQKSSSILSEAKEFFEEFIKDPLILD